VDGNGVWPGSPASAERQRFHLHTVCQAWRETVSGFWDIYHYRFHDYGFFDSTFEQRFGETPFPAGLTLPAWRHCAALWAAALTCHSRSCAADGGAADGRRLPPHHYQFC
jgi:hypothetical protein